MTTIHEIPAPLSGETTLTDVTAAPPQPGLDERPRTGRLELFTSLRLELLLSLAVLGACALIIAVFNVILLDTFIASRNGALYLGFLIVADVLVFVMFGAYKIRGLVLDPLEEIVQSTEAIAEGDLSRRAPRGNNKEFDRLSRSINRMTARLLEEQTRRAHLEKVASVGTLAAGVAHEIGNPLGAIAGYTHLLRQGASGNADLTEAVDGIERETERIDRIMRGMLEYARPSRRASVMMDINASVHRVIDLLRTQGKLRDVTLRLELEFGLPKLFGDVHELDQVLVNILLNAADVVEREGLVTIVTKRVPFSAAFHEGSRRADDPSGFSVERPPSARVRAWLNTVGEPAEVIKMVIADSGPGIPVADRERIFDPFYTTKEPGKGTGLGLSVAARIVESLGGTVWVRQAREGGAAFMFLFPVRPAPDGVDGVAGGEPRITR